MQKNFTLSVLNIIQPKKILINVTKDDEFKIVRLVVI